MVRKILFIALIIVIALICITFLVDTDSTPEPVVSTPPTQVKDADVTPPKETETTTVTEPVVSTPVTPEVPTNPEPPVTQPIIEKETMKQVSIETNKGTIVVELFAEDAPNTVENFLKLTNDGYYDGVIFHRVISGFMLQGGDPTGTGTGGPGYKFADELDASTESYQRGYVRGTLAMANAGPNTNGSQFFIMHADYPLPNAYTIFGRVVEGLDTVDAIAVSPVNSRDKPLEDVVMTKVSVVE